MTQDDLQERVEKLVEQIRVQLVDEPSEVTEITLTVLLMGFAIRDNETEADAHAFLDGVVQEAKEQISAVWPEFEVLAAGGLQ
jgi:hypothetical protein